MSEETYCHCGSKKYHICKFLFWIIFPIIAWGVFLSGYFTGKVDGNMLAIEHHAAHYDAVTGAFTWNDEVKQ